MDAVFVCLGLACCFHTAREILRLLGSPPPQRPQRAAAPTRPHARDARTGRSLTFRVDRRQGGRRVVDARSAGAGEARWSAVS